MRCNFVFIFIFAINALFAQQGKTNVNGTLVDKTSKQPIEFVTVVLLNKNDSTTKKGTITDKKGRFSIEEILPNENLLKMYLKPIYFYTKRIFRQFI